MNWNENGMVMIWKINLVYVLALDIYANLVGTCYIKLELKFESKDPPLIAFQQNKLRSQKPCILGVGYVYTTSRVNLAKY
jgi:hypothetical protein